MSTNNKTPDMQLSERVAKAIEKRDALKTRAIQFQTEVTLARRTAEAAREEAQKEHQVGTLPELLQKAQTFYKEDVAGVEAFEQAVLAFEADVVNAEKILAEVNAQ